MSGNTGDAARQKRKEHFIMRAKSVHGDKYDYSSVVYVNNSTKIIIGCPQHGQFTQTPGNHSHGFGCKQCAIQTIANKLKKYTYADFIVESKKLNDDRYIYDMTIDMNKQLYVTEKIFITCKLHGVFEQQINLHLAGANCPNCATEDRANQQRHSKEDFIRLAQEVHGQKYNYSMINYINSTSKIDIQCNICKKIFKQVPNSHLCGSGCRFCNKGISTTEEFIAKAKEIHGQKYDYTKTIYKRSQDKVTITCNISKEDFIQTPANHLKPDRGCPCCLVKRQSKGQQQWLDFLSVSRRNLQHGLNGKEHRITGTSYFADGYDPDEHRVYEFNGCYWHGCNKCFSPDENNKHSGVSYRDLKLKTLRREGLVRSQGYLFSSIWECDWYRACKAIKKLQVIWRKKATATSK